MGLYMHVYKLSLRFLWRLHMELDFSVLENIFVNGGRRSDGHHRMSIL